MKISIIVPMYNSEKTISRCIKSLTEQKNIDLELVLINDSSTDNTYDICNRFANEDSRIILIDSNGKGVSASRNIGLDYCTGEIIGFCDADDYYSENVLEHIAKIFEKEIQCNMVITGFNVCLLDGTIEKRTYSRKRRQLYGNKLFSGIMNDPNIMGSVWNKFFRRTALEKVRFKTDISLCEDTLFCVQCIKHNNIECYTLPLLTYNYVLNNNSVTHLQEKIFNNDYLKYFEFMDLLNNEYELSDFEIRQIKCARARIAYETLFGFELNSARKRHLVDEIKINRKAFICYGINVGKRTYISMALRMIFMR